MSMPTMFSVEPRYIKWIFITSLLPANQCKPFRLGMAIVQAADSNKRKREATTQAAASPGHGDRAGCRQQQKKTGSNHTSSCIAKPSRSKGGKTWVGILSKSTQVSGFASIHSVNYVQIEQSSHHCCQQTSVSLFVWAWRSCRLQTATKENGKQPHKQLHRQAFPTSEGITCHTGKLDRKGRKER